ALLPSVPPARSRDTSRGVFRRQSRPRSHLPGRRARTPRPAHNVGPPRLAAAARRGARCRGRARHRGQTGLPVRPRGHAPRGRRAVAGQGRGRVEEPVPPLRGVQPDREHGG
ncbi:unnamed protein product, partial [Prorocentrum cordatum]